MSDGNARAAAEAAVKSCYSTWAETYHADYYGASAYPPVHQTLVQNLLRDARARTLLDAGCGPGSMLRSLTGLGCTLYGFDLTPEMVREARSVMAPLGVPPDHLWEGSVADAAAFRPPQVGAAYDAAICIGVLPHVPPDIEESAIGHLCGAVRPGGLVAIEARNQLFALFTLNRYTCQLFENELIRVADLRESAREPVAVDQMLEDLQRRFRMDLPPVRGGKSGEPGYDQVLSRTHNPFVMQQQLTAAGCREVRVLFYHFHRLPPMFEPLMPDAFRELSLAMENPSDWRGHFMASAFIVTGIRQ